MTGSDNVCDVNEVSRIQSSTCGCESDIIFAEPSAAKQDGKSDLFALVHNRPDIFARFQRFVSVAGPDDCWLWTGNGAGKAQHGQFAVQHNRNLYAHRIAWFLYHGALPEGLKVCHHCDVPRCCNPAHLFLGTQADNLADARRKNRFPKTRRRRVRLRHGGTLPAVNLNRNSNILAEAR